MHTVTVLNNIAGAIAGLLAAWYWYQSARLKPPSELKGAAGYGGPVNVDTGPLVAFAQESARLNKKAALWTALAAFLMGFANIVQPFWE